MPIVEEMPRSDYRVLVSRSNLRPGADLYPFNLSDVIPQFALPLQGGDTVPGALRDREPIVDLGTLLDEVDDRSGYDYFIDYQDDPLPPLSDADRTWIDEILEQNLKR
jgi:hypothetical protein